MNQISILELSETISVITESESQPVQKSCLKLSLIPCTVLVFAAESMKFFLEVCSVATEQPIFAEDESEAEGTALVAELEQFSSSRQILQLPPRIPVAKLALQVFHQSGNRHIYSQQPSHQRGLALFCSELVGLQQLIAGVCLGKLLLR